MTIRRSPPPVTGDTPTLATTIRDELTADYNGEGILTGDVILSIDLPIGEYVVCLESVNTYPVGTSDLALNFDGTIGGAIGCRLGAGQSFPAYCKPDWTAVFGPNPVASGTRWWGLLDVTAAGTLTWEVTLGATETITVAEGSFLEAYSRGGATYNFDQGTI